MTEITPQRRAQIDLALTKGRSILAILRSGNDCQPRLRALGKRCLAHDRAARYLETHSLEDLIAATEGQVAALTKELGEEVDPVEVAPVAVPAPTPVTYRFEGGAASEDALAALRSCDYEPPQIVEDLDAPAPYEARLLTPGGVWVDVGPELRALAAELVAEMDRWTSGTTDDARRWAESGGSRLSHPQAQRAAREAIYAYINCARILADADPDTWGADRAAISKVRASAHNRVRGRLTELLAPKMAPLAPTLRERLEQDREDRYTGSLHLRLLRLGQWWAEGCEGLELVEA